MCHCVSKVVLFVLVLSHKEYHSNIMAVGGGGGVIIIIIIIVSSSSVYLFCSSKSLLIIHKLYLRVSLFLSIDCKYISKLTASIIPCSIDSILSFQQELNLKRYYLLYISA
jgi:hypothetical protein